MSKTLAAVAAEPVEFRMRYLKDVRARAVLLAAAEKIGWESGQEEGMFFSIRNDHNVIPS